MSASSSAAETGSGAISPEQERFFEEQVRPVLVAKCVDCHGPKKQESGLRLDSRQAMIDGGDSGERAVVPGEPDRSLLVKAINHLGDFHMPPESKLPDEQIAVLTDWIRQGLPWPQSSEAVQPQLEAADRAELDRHNHWAFQPVVQPASPAVKAARLAPHRPRRVRFGQARGDRPDSFPRSRPPHAHPPPGL